VSPPNGADLLQQLGGTVILMEATQPAATTDLFLLGALEGDTADTQDLCQESFDLTETNAAVYADPFFQAGPTSITQQVPLGGQSLNVTLADAEFSGLFGSTSGAEIDQITNGVFYGVIDVRSFGLPLGCQAIGPLIGLTLPCAPCPDDPSATECVVMWVENLTAVSVPGLDLVERTDVDISNDPNCN
jgi:hypothetical protein